MRRARAGDQGPVVVYADDDERVLQAYVAQRERMGAELVVVVRSLAPRPTADLPPWRAAARQRGLFSDGPDHGVRTQVTRP